MKHIDLRTTQNVVIEYELATLGDRILASIIDIVIISGMYLIFLFLSESIADFGASAIPETVLIFFLPVCSFLLYHFLSEVLGDGQSWGKKAVGIKVVRTDGREPSLSDYLLRTVFHLIDSLSSFGAVGAIFISSTAERRRLGDLTANTSVIRTKSSDRFRLTDIMKISTLKDYQPRYPEVKKFTEKDMLLIKNTLARAQRYNNPAHAAAVRELTEKVCEVMGVPVPKEAPHVFLKDLLRDYIVLTR